jgi:hypothetical protein
MSFQTDIAKAWFFSFKEACANMRVYLNIAVFSALLVMLEFWSWSIFVFISGFMSVVDNSA